MNPTPILKKSRLLYCTRQGHKTKVGGEHVHYYIHVLLKNLGFSSGFYISN